MSAVVIIGGVAKCPRFCLLSSRDLRGRSGAGVVLTTADRMVQSMVERVRGSEIALATAIDCRAAAAANFVIIVNIVIIIPNTHTASVAAHPSHGMSEWRDKERKRFNAVADKPHACRLALVLGTREIFVSHVICCDVWDTSLKEVFT